MRTRDRVFRVGEWPMAHFVQIERLHQKNASRRLEPFGLPHREWRVLAVLSEFGPLNINQIADSAATERSTMSKMVDRLEARGLIERAASLTDGRASTVALTEAGTALLEETIPIIRALFDTYRRGMDAQDYETLMQLLKAFRLQVAAADQ